MVPSWRHKSPLNVHLKCRDMRVTKLGSSAVEEYVRAKENEAAGERGLVISVTWYRIVHRANLYHRHRKQLHYSNSSLLVIWWVIESNHKGPWQIIERLDSIPLALLNWIEPNEDIFLSPQFLCFTVVRTPSNGASSMSHHYGGNSWTPPQQEQLKLHTSGETPEITSFLWFVTVERGKKKSNLTHVFKIVFLSWIGYGAWIQANLGKLSKGY